MPERSAALAVVRRAASGVPEVLLVHPGGPFFATKDEGAWSLPKGLLEPGEDALTAARREFQEETGSASPDGPETPLGERFEVLVRMIREGNRVSQDASCVAAIWEKRISRR